MPRSIDGWQHRLLGMFDEFTSLGKMTILEKALTYTRGYGFRLALITPSIKEIRREYGHDHTFFETTHTKLAMGIEDADIATEVSRWIPTTRAALLCHGSAAYAPQADRHCVRQDATPGPTSLLQTHQIVAGDTMFLDILSTVGMTLTGTGTEADASQGRVTYRFTSPSGGSTTRPLVRITGRTLGSRSRTISEPTSPTC